MITELTRLCTSCRALLPDPPAVPACPKCGALHVPLIAAWDPRVQYFLAACYTSRHAFLSFDSAQLAMEKLLQVTFNYAGSGPNPFGHLRVNHATPAVQLYPMAVQLAAHWRSVGAPIGHDLLERVGREAGLILASFPTRRAS